MLQLLLGRAGTGKTEYVFKSIKKLIDQGESNILLITPEQFSFNAQKRLLNDLGESRINEVEESSFSRLSGEILKDCNSTLPVLSKGAKAVLMKQAIEAVSDSLQLFKNNTDKVSFINLVINVYDEMKSCRVSSDDILRASEESERETLKLKLSDIALIISAYDALFNNEYYDPANELTRLYHTLLDMNYFENRTVFIDGFSGFVAQEYKIIEVILKQAKCVYITFCTDSFNNSDKFSLFSYVNSNIEILKDVASKINVKIAEPIYLKENKRAKNTELSLCEQYAFSTVYETTNECPKNIKMYNASNIIDECDNTAMNISSLLRQGYYAKDISVVCRDLDKYQSELASAFKKYNVPFYDDERQNINSQPLIMFVRFLLRTVINSFRSDDIFSLLKTGLTALESEDISELENYVFLWNINGSKWKNEFIQSTKGFTETISETDKKKLDSINESREYVIKKLLTFRKQTKNAGCADICKALYYAIIDFSADKKLKELAIALDSDGKSALADEQGRIWDMLMDILDSLSVIGKDKPITLKEFAKLFSLMISNEDLGTIPIGLDNVQLGSADRIRFDNPKVLFILGANEGEFPQSVSSSGLLSENDRMTLIENNFKLYSYGDALNAQERYFAYMAVSAPSEKLYISYCDNGVNTKSSIARGIKKIFPNLKEDYRSDVISLDLIESKDNAFEILASNYNDNDEIVSSLKALFKKDSDYSSRLGAVEALNTNEDVELCDNDISKRLFGYNMYLSASRIEDYYNCAFRYFCKFGLGARPRVKAEMDPMQTGTVIHYVLEQLIKDKKGEGLKSLDDKEIEILVNMYLNTYLNMKMGNAEQFSTRFKYQFMRLSKMLVAVVKRLKSEFEQSDFEPRAFELTIGDGSQGEEVRSKKLLLSDGGSIEIKGAIDRVDTFVKNNKQYVRVVDYKSGTKEFKLSDILNGLNLQMFIYLFTLCSSDSEYSGVESGVLYMHSARRLFSIDRYSSEKAVEDEENKLFKMKGVVLNDENNEIAVHMEHDLKGKYIPAKSSASKGITGNIVTLEELGRLSEKIDLLIEEMGINLHNGKINQNPINGPRHDKTCEFCDYSYVCMNRREIIKRDTIDVDNKKVLEIIKEEQDD